MTAARGCTRRSFLGALSGLILLPLMEFSLPGPQPRKGGQGEGELEESLRALLDPESARVVGRAYLGSLPQRATPTDVLDSLMKRLPPEASRASHGLGTRALRREVGLAIRKDFADGNTVQVDGWVMSRTEVEICALAFLG